MSGELQQNDINVAMALGRIEQKVIDLCAKSDEIVKQTTKTNGRVSTLENWRWFLTGGITLIGILLGWYVELHR